MNVSDLRGILTYIPQFREKLFVIAVDGAIIAHDNFSNLMLDIAVLCSLNIQVIIVHGISVQMQQIAAQEGKTLSNHDGTGTTDSDTLAIALTAANRVTHEIMEGLGSSDLRACYTNAVIAHPNGIVGGVDRQFTGKVDKIDTVFLQQLLEKDIIPVVPPLGFDGNGRTFRVNSDFVAQAIAESMKAAKLIYLGTHPGLLRGPGLVSQMSVQEADEFLRKSRTEIPANMISKVEFGIRACRNGVSRVHMIDGRVDAALLSEVFYNEGIGTMIYANEYTAIRRALKKDVSAIYSLIEESVQNEELVKRTRQSISQQIEDYFVFEIDRNIVACVALHPYSQANQAEMACMHVSRSHENQGIGRKLMAYLEDTARARGVRELFALSTQAFSYFEQKGGFMLSSPLDLPPDRREKHAQSGRNSRILVKKL
jgi:amino-acid N-acetyltransferase